MAPVKKTVDIMRRLLLLLFFPSATVISTSPALKSDLDLDFSVDEEDDDVVDDVVDDDNNDEFKRSSYS